MQACTQDMHRLGTGLGHVYISKQFPSLGTLSVTAWIQLVHICEQVRHSNFYSSVICNIFLAKGVEHALPVS